MERYRIGVPSLCVFVIIAVWAMVFSADCAAEQIRFADWVGVEETDPATNTKNRQIGTFAADSISSLWLAESDGDEDRFRLTLKSKKKIADEYFSYRIDRVDTLVIRSAVKGCESSCLEDSVPANSELIKTMKRGLKIEFEYDSEPDTHQEAVFSLRGFSKAFHWLIGK